ncbi:3-keto-disaccharide hydrolase [Formosa sp. 4Alg 33]|uniref:3-keto-disaccharide hydrolase n=1 Tax=Formosa sp. 4Alg 33 TaxID=3382189 RepID=UPI003D9C286B
MKIELKLIFILCLSPLFVNAQTDVITKKQSISVPKINYKVLEDSEPWKDTEDWTEVKTVSVDANGIPEDAIVLFSGNNLDAWQSPQLPSPANMEQAEVISPALTSDYIGQVTKWEIVDQAMRNAPKSGSVASKQSFGSVQMHIEWLAPKAEHVTGQDYSNSGIFFMGLYEVQVLNSYKNPTYSNGQASSVYKQNRPLVNASKPTDVWQSYDIVFTAPTFDTNQKLISPAYLTVFHNGVLVQNHFELQGPTLFIGESDYVYHQEKLPLVLQNHGLPVLYRNIWLREL